MKKFCRKGYLKRSGKRSLALLLSVCLIGTMIPVTARAENVTTNTGLCEHHTEHTPECGYVEDSVGSPCTYVCEICAEEAKQNENIVSDDNLSEQTEGKRITAWQWIDEEEILDEETGSLALPGASEEMPAYFDDVTAFLPTRIQATVVNADDSENPETGAAEETITLGDWSCDNYPEEGAYQGSYTFTATLPEGYVLADGVKELNVIVVLGGGSVFAWTPVDRATLQPGSTFDVNTITHGSTLGVDRYTMNQAGATYTITGYNWYDTVARFAVNQSCTIVLDNVTLKAGLTYEDDGVSNYNSGNHGIFEIAENIDVEFVLKGDSKLTAKQYYKDSMAIVSCILLGKGSTVSFSGDGNLDMNGKIARKFYDTTVADARLIMKSGRVSVDGIGNYRVRYAANGNIYSVDTVGGQVQITYEGGSLYNEQDDRTDAYKVEEWRTRNCSGDRYRVRIPINNTSKRTGLKIGADGTYSYIDYPNRGSLYTWHTRTSGKVIDYYVYNGNEYHHYRHTCAGSDGNDWVTEAIEVQDENSICGASGMVTVGGTVAGNETLTFQSQSGSEPFSKSVTTDENGSYYVAMPQGTYKASLKLSGSDTLYDMGTISLTSETKHTFDYSLSVLEGTVKDTSGNNLNNAVIIVSHNGTTYSLITGSDGKYRIVLPKGFAAIGEEISISADYLLSNKETGTVTYSDGIITKDFTLQQSETAEVNIYTEDDLILLSNSSALLSNKTINLMADISLTGDYPGIKYDSNITNMTLNGNGHSIRNLKKPLFYSPGDTSGTTYLEKCTISDLHLSGDIEVLNDVMYVGALAGGIYETKVEKCTFEGSITQGEVDCIGGLIGNASSDKSLIQNCFVHITNFDVSRACAMGGLCGELSRVRIKNCGVIIDKFGGKMHPSFPNARGAFVGYCYGKGAINNCYSVVKETETEVHRIQGNISDSENSVCSNNFSYAPTGVFPDDTDKADSTDLSAELMIAGAESGTGDREALIDRLNNYANNYGSWYRRADGYPSPIRGKFTVTYSGGTKGNGSQDAVTVLQEASVILPGAVYKNADYIQRGWTTTENGEKVYDLDASITPTENMTLYPYWKEKEAAPCTAPTDLSAYYGDTVGSIYLPEGFTWNAPDTLVGNAGAHTFMATYTPTGAEAETYGKNANVQISVTVKKASSNYTTLVSKVSNLTYNRTAQELVTAGTTSDGTIVYSLTEDGTYTTAIPTATNSGNYTVYYKIQGDDNHEDSRVGEISVSIGKASLAGATIILGDSLTFNGETQTQSIASVTVGDMTLGANDYTVTNNTESAVGTYTLTVTGQGNFEGSATKDFAIAKKAAVSVPDIDKKYVYAAGSKGAVISVDIASLLPNDRGVTTYSLATNSAEYVTEKAVGTDGILTYKVGTNGSVNDSTTLTVNASSDNYEDITVNVNILIMDKYTVVEMEDAKVAITGSNTLTYGQMLSTLTLNTSAAKFVEQENPTKEVTGTLAWETPDTIPNVGTPTAKWVFTPNDEAYAELEGNVSITVNKATPNVTDLPTVADRTYNPTVSLTNDDLTGGTVNVSGSWSWQTANIIPTVNNSGYVAVFTPTDSTNYETVTKTITVTVTKATPYIASAPTATAITYGDTLGASTLSGGTVQYSDSDETAVSGSFAWTDGSLKPSVSDSNTTTYAIVFTPSDADNYNTVETDITLTVGKAENAPNIPSSTMNVANSCTKVSDVTLPTGWVWQDADKDTALTVGTAVTATAEYNGADKGNYENETVSVTITRSECEHAHTELRDAKKATCSEAGYTGDTYCTDCGELLITGTTIPLADHQGGTATCTKKAVCTVCGKEYGTLDANNHVHTEIRGAATATCTAGGYTGDTYCTDCGVKTKTGTTTPALGHNYTSKVTTEPTTEKEGVRTYTCDRCGHSYTESIPKLPEETHEHSYSGSVTKEPTCTDTGVRTYTCSCGDSYTETIPALGHHYISSVTEQPTTSSEGVRTYTCDRCGHNYTESIPKLPEETHEHSYSGSLTKEPTCTDTGVRTYTCSCGDSYTETIPALGHYYVSSVTKQPTTSSEGVRTYTCDRCGHSYTESIPKLPEEEHEHSYSGSVTKEPTCTDTGVRTYTCSCGDSYTETIPALGHHYVSSVTKQPTTSSEGVMTYTCDRCGHSYTRPIDKLEDTSSNNPGDNRPTDNKPAENKPGDNQQPEDNKPDTGKPYIKDATSKEGWEVIKDEADKTEDGNTVVVEMNGSSVASGDVLDEIKGKDVTIVFDMGGGITWSVNGESITGDKIGDIDFSVEVGTNTIPVDAITNVAGERHSKQISLAYDGEFGFTAVLSINMEAKNAGLYANLFYYNEKNGKMEFICADEIAEDGIAELTFTHASDYAIVVDKETMDVASNETSDTNADADTSDSGEKDTQTGAEVSNVAWNPLWLLLIGAVVILIGLGVFLVAKKKKEDELE